MQILKPITLGIIDRNLSVAYTLEHSSRITKMMRLLTGIRAVFIGIYCLWQFLTAQDGKYVSA